jgi:hypothetical protein
VRSLVEKIGTLRAAQSWIPPYLQAIDDCLAIVRQHETEQFKPNVPFDGERRNHFYEIASHLDQEGLGDWASDVREAANLLSETGGDNYRSGFRTGYAAARKVGAGLAAGVEKLELIRTCATVRMSSPSEKLDRIAELAGEAIGIVRHHQAAHPIAVCCFCKGAGKYLELGVVRRCPECEGTGEVALVATGEPEQAPAEAGVAESPANLSYHA